MTKFNLSLYTALLATPVTLYYNRKHTRKIIPITYLLKVSLLTIYIKFNQYIVLHECH